MERYEIDGMIVDDIIYWWDQPIVYLGRRVGGDDRPHLVVLVEDSGSKQVYHRLTLSDERGLRGTFAAGAAPTSATYDLAIGYDRLDSSTGEEEWETTTRDRLIELDGPPTSLPPSRSRGHVEIFRWGVDHWTLLRELIERSDATAAGQMSTLDYRGLRINPRHHLVQAPETDSDSWSSDRGTRLAGHGSSSTSNDDELRIDYHDDVDCLEEMEDEGLLEIVSTFKGQFLLTSRGRMIGRTLKEHLLRHGSVDGFRHGTGIDEIRTA